MQQASELEQLKSMTVVVADTGDIDAIAQLKPTEATTNPSLILKAATGGKYGHILEAARSVNETAQERLIVYSLGLAQPFSNTFPDASRPKSTHA